MKKVILLLLLMLLNINGMLIDSHAEYSHQPLMETEYVNPYANSSVKNLLVEEMSITEIMNIVHDEMVIDNIFISKYKESLSKYETGGKQDSYSVKNKYGYAGKYQFGKSTLITLYDNKLIDFDVKTMGIDIFLQDSVLQEKALNALIIYNLNYLKNKNLFRFIGKKFHGTVVTTEGLLASSHLVGASAVRHFLENNGSLEDFYIQGKKCRKIDGNGVSLVDYMKIFENV